MRRPIDPLEHLAPGAEEWWAATSGWQRLALLVGLGLVVLALLVPVLFPGVVGQASMLATVGLVGGLLGVAIALRDGRHRTVTRRAPAVEARPAVTRAGQAFDTAVERASREVTGRAIHAESAVRSQLRALAVAVLSRHGGDTRSAAEARIDAGDWPDETAGTLFRSEADPAERGWLRGLFGRHPDLAARVGTVVDRLEAIAGVAEATAPDSTVERERPRGSEWLIGPYRTGRWRGLLGVALVVLMAGALVRSTGATLMAAVLLGVAGYSRLFEAPDIDLAIQRTLSPPDPRPGTETGVEVTVRNTGDRPLLDLRVVDAVPDSLTVVGGTPRHATALAAGESTTFEYTVPATAGEHVFDAAYVEVRDPSGERARTATVETAPTTMDCDPRPRADSVPLHPQETGLTGHVPTEQGGTGLEFHSVRGYRRGDPLSRVDWNRLARTGELATRQFREEHAATVVLLVDARPAAAVAPGAGTLTALDRARIGAARLADSLLSDGDRVGLATIAPDPAWLAPGAGTVHRERVGAALHPGEQPEEWSSFAPDRYVRQLRRRLPAASQLLCLSPLLDDEVATVLQHLHAHGHQVSLVSPDPTSRATLGARVARLERATRLGTLRDAGIRVVDWPAEDDHSVALERARRGWRS